MLGDRQPALLDPPEGPARPRIPARRSKKQNQLAFSFEGLGAAERAVTAQSASPSAPSTPPQAAQAPGDAPLTPPHAAQALGDAPLTPPHAAQAQGDAPLTPPHAAQAAGDAPLTSPHAAEAAGDAPLPPAHAAEALAEPAASPPLAPATVARALPGPRTPVPSDYLAPTTSPEETRAHLARSIARVLGVRVEVELTKNRRTMISTSRSEGALRVRLHQMFVDADGGILEAIGRYVRTGDRRASRMLGDFIEEHRDRLVATRPRTKLRPRGQHHDLARVFADVEAAHFPGELEGVGITWGRKGAPGPGRRRKRTIRLGTYTHDERLIRVHPVLDQDWVPRHFVEYIVFHEMLHHVEPAREEDGRTVFHTREFRRREQRYPGYAEAIAWERANITRLLSS